MHIRDRARGRAAQVSTPGGNKVVIRCSGSAKGPTLELSVRSRARAHTRARRRAHVQAPSLNFGSLLIGEAKKLVVNITNPNPIPVAWHIQACVCVSVCVCLCLCLCVYVCACV